MAPRDAVEEALAEIWAEVLGLRAGRRARQLLRAGRPLAAGDARGLVAGAQALRHRAARCAALFEAPTVAELAERDRGERKRQAAQCQPPVIVPVARDGALPLSFAQQRLWFLDQLEPGSAVYNIPAAVRLVRRARCRRRCGGRWTRSCAGTRRCGRPSPTVDGSPVQVIAPAAELALPVDGPVRAGRGGARGAGWRRAARGGATAVRPGGGPAAARAAAAAGRRGARAAADDAPHRLRRLVDGRAHARAGGAVRRRIVEGRALAAAELPVQYADYARLAAAVAGGRACSSGSWRTGRSSWRARRRCWSCRPTGRGRRCRPIAGGAHRWSSLPSSCRRGCRR